jgi:hypothetical protein
VNGWIGVGNHRYFVKAILAATLFAWLSVILGIRALYLEVEIGPKWLCDTIIAITVGLGGVVTMQAVAQWGNLSRGRTIVEMMENRWFKKRDVAGRDGILDR